MTPSPFFHSERRKRFITDVLDRWDDLAYEQLCEAAARLVEENETLQADLWRAQDDAESWRQDCINAICDDGGSPGLTMSGHIVRVPGGEG